MGIHGNTGDYRSIQGLTGGYRGLQGVTKDTEKLKTMPLNNEDAHLQTQNLGLKVVIFEALFESLPCFQCS